MVVVGLEGLKQGENLECDARRLWFRSCRNSDRMSSVTVPIFVTRPVFAAFIVVRRQPGVDLRSACGGAFEAYIKVMSAYASPFCRTQKR